MIRPPRAHHANRLAGAVQQGSSLGVHRGPPVLGGQVEDRLVEVLHIRPGVGDEDVERTEGRPHLREHSGNVLGDCHIGLDQHRLGATIAQQAGGLLGGLFVLLEMDADPRDAAACEFQRDASSDPARTAGDQSRPGFHLDADHHEPPLGRCTLEGAAFDQGPT